MHGKKNFLHERVVSVAAQLAKPHNLNCFLQMQTKSKRKPESNNTRNHTQPHTLKKIQKYINHPTGHTTHSIHDMYTNFGMCSDTLH